MTVRHIGLFGGSFNPVHSGHIIAAASVKAQLALDEIHFIPAARSPFKRFPQIKDVHRLAMLELAISELPDASIDSRELDTSGPSYTIDTLKHVAAEQPDDHLYLLIGMDAWLAFERWKKWQSILEHCHLVVMTRPAYERPALSDKWALRQLKDDEHIEGFKAGKVLFVSVPSTIASLSEIRRLLSLGKDAGDYLPESVAAYIKAQGLYQ